MNEKNWKKNPNWTWKRDVRFYLYQKPLAILSALKGIAQKDHILNEMDWREYMDLMISMADMKCGRLYTYVEE
jgi:hypothetical protein